MVKWYHTALWRQDSWFEPRPGRFTSEASCPGMGEKGAPLANITDVMFAGAGGRPGPADLFGGGGRRVQAGQVLRGI